MIYVMNYFMCKSCSFFYFFYLLLVVVISAGAMTELDYPQNGSFIALH